MFALLSELKLWTLDENISIKDTDFGAFRYYDKRVDNLYEEGKRSYCETRGMVYAPQNKKGIKLKDSLKYLEEQLKAHSTIYCQWNDHCTVSLMLGSGLFIYIQIGLQSGDIEKIVFDKYLVGKVSDHISDVLITKNHVICTYNDSQVTLVHFTKSKRHLFDKISRLEPKINTFELCGPSGRRLDKKIQLNRSGDLVLIWWKSTMNEVYPWSPTVKEHDRANVQIYRLTGTKMELICYLRTEFDPLCITFNTFHENVIHSVEQKVSRKGEVTIEWRTYEVSQQDKLQRIAVVSVPLPTHTSCVKFSPNQEMLLLCCIDGSMTLHDQSKGTSNTVKAAFIPTHASWHGDGTIFSVGNERGQFQHFDIALSCIKNQMLSEEATPTNILDLSSYFRNQPALLRMEWSIVPDSGSAMDYYKAGDALFLLLFERGPLGVIRIIEGSNFPGDVLVEKYLGSGQVDRAASLLLFMNWDTHPQICMHSLNQIVNYLFKLPLTSEREDLIQKTLGCFHVPLRPISQAVEDRYGDEVRDLTRRFFHHLLSWAMPPKEIKVKRFKPKSDAVEAEYHLNLYERNVKISNASNTNLPILVRILEASLPMGMLLNVEHYDPEKELKRYVPDTEMISLKSELQEQPCQLIHQDFRYLTKKNAIADSTCSRTSCSLCSNSSEKEDSYTEESETEETPKKEKFDFTLPKNPEKSSSQAPPLPVLPPPLYSNSNFVSTSFKEVPSLEKSEGNLMSTAFNLPTYSPGSFNNLIHLNSNVPQTPLSKTHFSQSLTNVEGLIPGFGSLNLHPKGFNYSLEAFGNPPFAKSSFQEETFENPAGKGAFGKDNSQESSTSFSVPPFENPDILSPNLPFAGKQNPIGLFSKPGSSLFYNSGSNLMSTSFNDPEEEEESPESNRKINPSQVFQTIEQKKRLSPFDIPPPPQMSSNLANYIQSLPKKNFPLTRSTPGLTEMEETVLRIQNSRPIAKSTQIVQKQSSVSNILQNQHRSKFQSTRNYRLNYDLNYVPFSGSCDNISSPKNIYPGKSYATVKERQFRIGQGIAKEGKKSSNVPPLPVINPVNYKNSPEVATTSSEKPKVKFSDTVTHILVPGSNS
ncbi:WD repeat-containing and planar cell polarity effector protein fritz [Belonocnema kinseyi]|uniref:WD repeat-containing and planar cell polarity effector protein fritz n=1 Tax=Belonocnema kinseyi TaxID=2817044 RepID=UPI00143CF937|nr:WD repeat-containing and planar cell polarity effector protein fritz [Belonocnema kinseyi]